VKIQLIDENCKPAYHQKGDVCMDCRARTDIEWVWEKGLKVAYIPLGFKVKVPLGYALKLYSRSGQAWNYNITLANSVGIIDGSFREEVQVKLIHHSISVDTPPSIKQYDRVCQMALVEHPVIYLEEVDKLPRTNRGKGLGSSGNE